MIIKDYYIKNKKGFTLIELMVVITILGFVILGLVSFFAGGTRSWITGQSQITAQRNARQAMDLMIKEIREGEKLLSGSDGNTIIVSFPLSFSKDNVTYRWSGTPGDPINRIVNAVSSPLINDVHYLHFGYYDEDGNPIGSISASRVNINLQVDVDNDGNPDIDLTTEVNLRNFGL